VKRASLPTRQQEGTDEKKKKKKKKKKRRQGRSASKHSLNSLNVQ
jgi:hypothetical protein